MTVKANAQGLRAGCQTCDGEAQADTSEPTLCDGRTETGPLAPASPALADFLQGGERWRVERADSIALLRSLPDASIDAIITDPPYSSGGLHLGERTQAPSKKYVQNGAGILRPEFFGDNRDQLSFFLWCAMWLTECQRIAKPGAPICVFCDWRQVALANIVLQVAGFVLRGVLSWDKTENCRKQNGRFAAQSEFIVWGSNGPMARKRGVGCLPGVFRVPVVPGDKLHITGKPTDLMLKLVEICSPQSLVLDPFCGSGTTGVAALRRGHRFLGIEREATYAEISRERLEAEARGQPLGSYQSRQMTMFRGETA